MPPKEQFNEIEIKKKGTKRELPNNVDYFG